MSSTRQMLDLCLEKRNNQAKSKVPRPIGPSWLNIFFVMILSTSAICIGRPEEPRTRAHTNEANPESAAAKRPVTVADSIQMTRLGDLLYNDGAPSKGLVAKFSPDGKQFVVILRKGNLESNTNEYSLMLFDTNEVFRSPSPRVLLSMSSSSNRPAIQNVVWLGDNDTILFLGEHPGERTQLYSFKCNSNELKALTNHATNLAAFVVSATSREIVFAAEDPDVLFLNPNTAREGVNVTSEELSDLIAGKHGGGEDADHTLFIKQPGSETEITIKTEGRVLPSQMWLSPDGLHLVLQTEATHVPSAWSGYNDQFLKPSRYPASASGARTSIFQYELVDLATGTSRLLLDGPIPPAGGSEMAWSRDSESVVVSDMYLPLNTDDAAQHARRKAHTFLAEVKIPDRQLVEISDEDLRLLSWDAKTNEVVCDVGRVDSLIGTTTRKVYFRKSNDAWVRSTTPHEQEKAVPALPDIVLGENMNQPPRILAIDPDTGRKSLLMDLNPQLQSLALARVEEIAWKSSGHEEVKAGLYWPVDYIVGKKYPLVIQTHGWNPDRFWMDGPWTTAFAAQALAGKGFFVLQVYESPNDIHLLDTPKEVLTAMAVYDSAINFLDRRRLIDGNRIGIIGFSRTYYYVTYALTHSKHHFAAAALAEGADFGYFQYMAFSNHDQASAGESDQMNGAPPFGQGLLKWLKASPAFLMDKIETPLRIHTMGPDALLGNWHWFAGLTRLEKPVEMIYLPEGTHVLERPWDRMISQQGNVDWFCFWLKDEEDPSPAKAEQYKRWRHLRDLSIKSSARAKSK
jgi:dipeptidyl aminopeptidase/acylaminoacyl peptidase